MQLKKLFWVVLGVIATGVLIHVLSPKSKTTPEAEPQQAIVDEPVMDGVAAPQEAQKINDQITQEVDEYLESLRKPLDMPNALKEFQLLESRMDTDMSSWWPVAIQLRERVAYSVTDTPEKHKLLKRIDRLISDRTAADMNKKFQESGETPDYSP